MPAAFSRLQLAAALLEYDNDSDNPDAPRRSAQESAIFAHFRRNLPPAPRTTARQSDYLGISLPSETGSLGGRESVPGTRRSRGSIDALQNPFGTDSNDGEEAAEEELEVDLTSWGLDAFMPKDKTKKGKGKAPSVAATAPPTTTVRSHMPSTNTEHVFPNPRRAVNYSRSMSLGGSVDFLRETGNAPTDFRRRSIASPLDVANMEVNRATFPRQRSSSTSIMQGVAESSQGVPFPTGSTRATSPGPSESVSGRRAHERTFSMASMNSRMLLADVKEESRPHSTYDEYDETPAPEDNPFALQPPSRTSRFDPKYGAHARTISNASIGTRVLLNDDRNSVMTGGGGDFNRERRYSTTLDLLRPKVLVMPSPLQSTAPPEPPSIDNRVRDGFTLSRDGPPLPPGARTSRRLSILLGIPDTPPPIASNSFTPNPLSDLTPSQQLFRNTLAVDGRFDTFPDDLPRAIEDGEQAQLYPEELEPEEPPPSPPLPDTSIPKRPPGKLYGKSLIDDLESRKAQMRSKQRVFYGDQRPLMMARGEIQRSSTLIDPATLGRPTSQFLNHSASEGLIRRNSGNIKPLLSFENDKIPQTAPMPGRVMNSHSVFGVDKLWEREMVKLREIEAQEKIEEEECRKREEEEERRRSEKKGKKKRKDKKQREEPTLQPPEAFVAPQSNDEPRVSVEPPVLPAIERSLRRPPPPVDDEDDEESDDDEIGVVSAQPAADPAWHAGSSDEEDGPRRTTGIGPRYPNRGRGSQTPAEADSDEDLPLAATLHKVLQNTNSGLHPSRLNHLEEDEDEERPLSSLLAKAKVKKSSSSLLDVNFDKLSVADVTHKKVDDDEDDDEPLGLRASRIPPVFSNGDEDDDDRPLGLHPEQQRRTQYEMFAQQQQQQQMMMQAQFQNSMLFNSSMMGSGFFAPPMATPMMAPMNPLVMMQPPMSIPSPPPVHDAAKYGRVDRWRRDVAVEGER